MPSGEGQQLDTPLPPKKDLKNTEYSLCVLFSQNRSCDNTPSYSRVCLRIIYEKRKGQVPLGPLLGKENIQAKEVC